MLRPWSTIFQELLLTEVVARNNGANGGGEDSTSTVSTAADGGDGLRKSLCTDRKPTVKA